MQKTKTIKQLHAELKSMPVKKRDEVLTAIGCNPQNSHAVFYEILNGTRKINPAEAKAIAAIYNVDPIEIDWNGSIFLPE